MNERWTLAEALLTEHMDGDFLIEAGMGLTNAGEDVGLNDARPKEVAHWAEDAALAWVDARLTDPATVEAVAEALRDQLGYSGSELMPMLREQATAALAAVQGLLGVEAP